MAATSVDTDKETKQDNNAGAQEQAKSELLTTQEASIQDATFGVLYTITKEKFSENAKIAVGTIILDWLQIMFFLFSPSSNFKWSINISSNPFMKYLNMVQLQNPLVGWGYPIFAVFFYLGVGLMVMSSALIVYVAHNFKTNSFPYVWPIKFLRFVVSVVLDAFYISALNIFLMGPNCNYSKDMWGQRMNGTPIWIPHYHNNMFPDVYCFAMPHIIMLVVGSLIAILSIVISYLMVIGTAENDHLTINLQGYASPSGEVRMWLVRTIIATVSTMFNNYNTQQAWILALTSWYLTYVMLRKAPHFNFKINCLKAALYSVLLWSTSISILLIYGGNAAAAAATYLLFGGIPCSFAIGWTLMHVRQRAALRVAHRFREAWPGFEGVTHKFFDPSEVEIAARVCRQRHPRSRELYPEWVDTADALYRAGIKQFPESSLLSLTYANFLLAVKKDSKAGYAQLDRTRKLRITFGERFAIFVRDRERKQRSGTEHAGDTAMDLVSYVEFQNNFKSILSAHTAAMKAIRSFWRHLLHRDVAFVTLSNAFHQMDLTEAKADKVYRSVLERYPKSVKLLRIYGRFLEDVKNDPWSAARMYNEAERIEDIQAEAARDAAFTSRGVEGGDNMASMVDDASDAVVVINDVGVVQFTNRIFNKMFGYRKGEMDGKNVSLIMPQPFSQNHNQYLKNYKQTGTARVLGRVREVIALHKQRHVFPVRLTVTKIQQGGTGGGGNERAAFMGVIKEVPEGGPGEATLWLTAQGNILCTNKNFTEVFGFKNTEVLGKSLKSVLAMDSDQLEKHMSAVGAAAGLGAGVMSSDRSAMSMDETPEDTLGGGDNVVYAFEARCRHKYGASTLSASVTVTLAGTDTVRIYVLHLRQSEMGQGVIAMDDAGVMKYVSATIEQGMLGHQAGALTTGSVPLGRILPFPFAIMHQRFVEAWGRKFEDGGAGSGAHRAVSCAAGRIVPLYARGGRLVPCSLKLGLVKDSGRTLYTASVQRAVYASQWEERGPPDEVMIKDARIRLLVRGDGRVLLSDAAPQRPALETVAAPEPLFGYYRQQMEGKNLSDMMDVFQQAVENSKLFNSDSRPESVLPPLLAKMDAQGTHNGVYSWRVGLKSGPARRVGGWQAVVACVSSRMSAMINMETMVDHDLVTDPAPLQTAITEGLAPGAPEDKVVYVVDIYRVENLQGVIELERSGRIKRVDKSAALILGRDPDSIQSVFFMTCLASPPPQSKLASSLGLKPSTQIGDRTPVALAFVDSSTFMGEVTLCARNEDASRLQGLIHAAAQTSFDPIGSFKRMQDMLHKPIKASEGAPGLDSASVGPRGVRFGGVPDPAEAAAEAAAAAAAAAARGGAPVPSHLSLPATIGALAAAKKFTKAARRGSVGAPLAIQEDDRISTISGVPPTPGGGGTASARARRASLPSQLSGTGLRRGSSTGVNALQRQGTNEAGLASVGTAGPGTSRLASARARRGSADRSVAGGAGGSTLMRASMDLGSRRSYDSEMMTLDRRTSFGGRSDGDPDEMTVAEDDVMSEEVSATGPAEKGVRSSDFRRAKKFRRLKRVLTSARARRSITALQLFSRVVAIIILLVHVGVFVLTNTLVLKHERQVAHLTLAGNCVYELQSAVYNTRALLGQALGAGRFAALGGPDGDGRNTTAVYAELRAALEAGALTFESSMDTAMTAFVNAAGQDSAYDEMTSRMAALEWIDTDAHPAYGNFFRSTWDLTRELIRNVRHVALDPSAWSTGDQIFTDYAARAEASDPSSLPALGPDHLAYNSALYVLNNAPEVLYSQLKLVLEKLALPLVLSSVKNLYTTITVVLLAEGTLVVPACAFLMYTAVKAVMKTRINLFNTFLLLPKHTIISLATRKIKLDEEDSDEEIEDDVEFERLLKDANEDEDVKKAAKEAAERRITGFASAKVDTKNRRTLRVTQSAEMYKLMGPFVLYGCILVILCGIVGGLLKNAVEPLAALSSAEALYSINGRLSLAAQGLVTATDPFSRDKFRGMLNSTINDAEALYRSVLLGGGASANTGDVRASKTRSIIATAKYQALLFGAGCLRSGKKCVEAGDPLYESTTRGLDALWQAYIQNAQSLLTVPDAALSLNGSYYAYMQAVAPADVKGGLGKLKSFFETDNLTALHVVNILGAIVFVVFLIGNLVYLVATRPFLKMTAAESKRVAELMSLLPEDMDVETLVIQAGGIQQGEKKDEKKKRKRRIRTQPLYVLFLAMFDKKLHTTVRSLHRQKRRQLGLPSSSESSSDEGRRGREGKQRSKLKAGARPSGAWSRGGNKVHPEDPEEEEEGRMGAPGGDSPLDDEYGGGGKQGKGGKKGKGARVYPED